jgi:thioredoxin-disulfide reductase
MKEGDFMKQIYDVIIIGSGPAGLSAGLYAGRAKMKALMIEKGQHGGQIMSTNSIENYPGSLAEESGESLTARMVEQCKTFGLEIVQDTVLKVQLDGVIKTVECENETYETKTIIIATGTNTKNIGCIGEEEFVGRGISYCATCDAAFFSGLPVYVIGGGDSAIEEAIYLTKFAREVTVIHRREGFRANKASLDKARQNPNIKWLLNRKVVEIKGDGLVESIVLEDVRDGSREEIHASQEDGTFGIFAFIGLVPQTELFKGLLEMDEQGYIISDDKMQTSVEGVFVAGDCRQKLLRQVVTAVSDGAIATVSAEKYIEESHQ